MSYTLAILAIWFLIVALGVGVYNLYKAIRKE